MSGDLKVLGELEARLRETYYGPASRLRGRPRSRLWAPIAAVSVLAMAVAGVFALLPGSGDPAPTLARAALDRAAAAAASGSAVRLTPGKLWYVKTLQINDVRAPLHGRPGAPLVTIRVRTVTQTWAAASGRTIGCFSVRYAYRYPRNRWNREMKLPQPVRCRPRVELEPGKLQSPLVPGQRLLSYAQIEALPSSVSGLAAAIHRLTGPWDSNPEFGTLPRWEWPDMNFVALSYMLTLPVSPSVRAGLYRTAARLPDVRYLGPARDLLGRRGVAVSIYRRGHGGERMILNPRTGALLGTNMIQLLAGRRQGNSPWAIEAEKVVSAASAPRPVPFGSSRRTASVAEPSD